MCLPPRSPLRPVVLIHQSINPASPCPSSHSNNSFFRFPSISGFHSPRYGVLHACIRCWSWSLIESTCSQSALARFLRFFSFFFPLASASASASAAVSALRAFYDPLGLPSPSHRPPPASSKPDAQPTHNAQRTTPSWPAQLLPTARLIRHVQPQFEAVSSNRPSQVPSFIADCGPSVSMLTVGRP